MEENKRMPVFHASADADDWKATTGVPVAELERDMKSDGDKPSVGETTHRAAPILDPNPHPDLMRDWRADFNKLHAELVRLGYGRKAIKKILEG